MAYSYVNYTATGGQANWTFPFKYLDAGDIFVTVNNNIFFSQLVGPNTVQIVPTPIAGDKIKIFRNTVHDVTPVDFTDGSVLEEKALDRLALFCLYSAQEAIDREAGDNPLVIGGGGLTMPEIIDGLNSQLTLDAFALSLRNEIGLISGSAEVIGSVAWNVLQEANARADALIAEAAARGAAIQTETTARQTAVESISSQLLTLTAHLNDNSAAILQEQSARVADGEATANRISVLEANTAATGDGSVLVARVSAVEKAVTDSNSANATAISQVRSDFGAGDRAVSALVTQEASSRSAADSALATRAAALEARVNMPDGKTVMSLIADVQTAQSAGDATNAQSIQTVQSSVAGLAGTVSSNATRLASVETQASTSATQLGVVNANQTIKVQARSDGRLAVAGIGLNATATGSYAQSEMIFLADKFQFVSSGAGINEVPQPLMQLGLSGGVNTLILAPTRYGDQTIAARMIIDGTITAQKIDTRGLTIKDLAGNVILSAGGGLDYSYVANRPVLFRVAAAGYADTHATIGPGFYAGETGALLCGATRSYALIRIRRSDAAVTFAQLYDVFGAGADPSNSTGYGRGAAQLAADLNATGSDSVVVVYTSDEPRQNRLTAGLDAAMYRCGASRAVFGSPQFLSRSAYVLIGVGNCGEGNGYESYNGSADTLNAWCDVSFQIKSGQLIIGGGGATPRTLADYSYTGDMNATNGATFGTNIFGQITASNISTYIASAAISWAYIGNLNISTDGSIRSGQVGFDNGTGYWMGMEAGIPKMSMGNIYKGFTWDGFNFTVRGNIISTGNLQSGVASQTVAGAFQGSGRLVGSSVTGKDTALTIGFISTSAQGDGRVVLLLAPSEWPVVNGWQNLSYIGECSMTDVGGNVQMYFQVRRNGIVVYQQVLNGPTNGQSGTITRMNHCQIVTDTPGPGVGCTYTYEIHSYSDNPTNMAHQIMGGTFVLSEFKK